jgi:hypothetical protein
MKNKNKNKKGKGIIGDIFKSAYYIGSKIISPKSDLKYGELH